MPTPNKVAVPGIDELWLSRERDDWTAALERYWLLVRPLNVELERSLEALEHDRLATMNGEAWLHFLREEYFRWKYTAPNRYATTTAALARGVAKPGGLAHLSSVKERLLVLEPEDIPSAVRLAQLIPGLGTAGASGLLALLYPKYFGTVDQVVVKALRLVPDLTEAAALASMNPEGLQVGDAVVLTQILRRQARELATAFRSEGWTPRAVDKVLWTYGR